MLSPRFTLFLPQSAYIYTHRFVHIHFSILPMHDMLDYPFVADKMHLKRELLDTF